MPRYVNADLRRSAIVHAAWQLIADEGFEALTIRRLGREVGGASGRVTHYFASKEEVLIAVLGEVTDSHRSGLNRLRDKLLEAGPDAGSVARAIVDVLPLDEASRRDWRVWLAFWSQAAVSPNVATRHRQLYRSWRKVLAEAIQRIDPGCSRDDVADRAEQLLACIDGLGVHLLIEPGRVDRTGLERMLRAHLHAVTVTQ